MHADGYAVVAVVVFVKFVAKVVMKISRYLYKLSCFVHVYSLHYFFA